MKNLSTPAESSALAPSTLPLRASKRILLVDDDAGIRESHAALLQSTGFDVEVARDGEQALLMLAFRPFDLLVTDWHMPRFDGASLVLWLRAANNPIPIIMHTGSTHQPIPVAIEQEVHAILRKPSSARELLHIAHRILNDCETVEGLTMTVAA